jgi:hypothetical protein
VLVIVAGILVARHLKTTDDRFDCRSSPEDGIFGRRCRSMGGADHVEDRQCVLWLRSHFLEERAQPFMTTNPHSSPTSIFYRLA